MDKDTSWAIIDQQRSLLADLLDNLTAEQWSAPSLCEGWTVRDVAAHLSLAATASMGETINYLVHARGNFDGDGGWAATGAGRRRARGS